MKFLERYKDFLLFILFASFVLWVHSFHEIWRDEVQAWHIVSESHSLSELWHNVRYEGHPFLWFFILFLGKQCTPDIQIQFWLHFSIILLCATVLIRKAPLPFWFKVLILFGYYFGYEYAVIQRNYSLGILFLLLQTWAIHERKSPVFLVLFGILAMFSNIHAAILSSGLFLYFFLAEKNKKVILPVMIIFILSLFLLWIDISPPTDAQHFRVSTWNTERAINILSCYADGLTKFIYWGHSLPDTLKFLFAFALLILPVKLLYPDKPLIVLWAFVSITFCGFWYFYYAPFIRHYGHVFILFVLILWLTKKDLRYSESKAVFISALLIISCSFLLGIFQVAKDYSFKISHLEETVDYIKKNRLYHHSVLGYKDYTASPIAYFLHRKIYYPEIQKEETYIKWTEQRNQYSEPENLNALLSIWKDKRDTSLVILNRPLQKPLPVHTIFLKRFSSSYAAQHTQEVYYLYLISPKGSSEDKSK